MDVAWGRRQPGTDDPYHDCRHGDVLVAPGWLAEHALGDQQQHQETGRQCWLHDHERSKQQRQHLQRPAEDREPCAEQPASAPDEARDERQAQVLVMGRFPGIECLQGDP